MVPGVVGTGPSTLLALTVFVKLGVFTDSRFVGTRWEGEPDRGSYDRRTSRGKNSNPPDSGYTTVGAVVGISRLRYLF